MRDQFETISRVEEVAAEYFGDRTFTIQCRLYRDGDVQVEAFHTDRLHTDPDIHLRDRIMYTSTNDEWEQRYRVGGPGCTDDGFDLVEADLGWTPDDV